MTENDQERYRRRADECLQQAENARNPMDKEAWLKMAAEWTQLAQDAERPPHSG
jgi:hypothetical protein